MKHYPAILLLMLGAFGGEACRYYLQTHRPADAVVAGVGAASVVLVAGMAPSPSQGKQIDKLQDAVAQRPGE